MNDPRYMLTAEEKLLISLCRLTFSEKQRSGISDQIIGVRDWDHFVHIANEHGVIALCWFNITEMGFSYEIPAVNLAKLHSGYLKSLTRNTFLYKHLEEILSLAEKENIKVVLLKGVALEITIFGNKGLRQMNDIDILVRKDKALLLRNILLKNGFESMPMFSRLHEKIMPAYGKHLPEMIKKGISTEIHFRLFDQIGNSLTEEILSKADKLTDNETDVYYPDPQLFFLYLIKHLDKHEKEGNSQLRLYTDLVVLLSIYYDKIINRQLFDYAIQANIENALIKMLYLLRTYWDIDLPDWIVYQLDNTRDEETNKRFIHFLRNPNDGQVEEGPESLLYPIKDMPRISDKFLYIFGYVFPSLTFMKYRYRAKTTARAILFYPVRWKKLPGLIVKGKLFRAKGDQKRTKSVEQRAPGRD